MKRRTFLDWIGVGILANSLPAIIVACSNSPTKSATLNTELNTNATAATTDNFYMVGITAELDENGFILNEDITNNPIMVFRHPDTKELIALNPRCTHQQCNVEVDQKANLLVCPCHDSRFSFDGKVVKSPARIPLDIYPVKQERYLILVEIA